MIRSDWHRGSRGHSCHGRIALIGSAITFTLLLVACSGGNPESADRPENAPEIVGDAIDATLEESFVAQATIKGPGEGFLQTTTYHPADPGADRAVSGEVVSQPVGFPTENRLVVLPEGSGALSPCGLGRWASTCDPGQWVLTSADVDLMSRHTGIGSVNTDSASPIEAEEGVYAVTGRTDPPGGFDLEEWENCPGQVCSGRIHVADGLVVRLDLGGTEGHPAWSWTYGSFGDAPTVTVPPPEDIISPG